MGLLESFLESLGKNAKDAKTLDSYLMAQTITRGIPYKKTKKKLAQTNKEEEFMAITGAAGFGAIEIREGASQEEIEATQKYMDCIKKLQEKGRYSESEQQWLLAKAKTYREAIIKARKEYDNAGEYISDTVSKANEVLANLKSPKYIADKNKSLFKYSYYGIDDPFYDRMKELYGEEGLLGYRKERAEAFKKIPLDRVKLASQRYQKVNTWITHIKNVLELPLYALLMFKLYPELVSAGGNPIVMAFSITGLYPLFLKCTENARDSKNYQIMNARKRIAADLGLIEKGKSFLEIEKEQYKDEEGK